MGNPHRQKRHTSVAGLAGLLCILGLTGCGGQLDLGKEGTAGGDRLYRAGYETPGSRNAHGLNFKRATLWTPDKTLYLTNQNKNGEITAAVSRANMIYLVGNEGDEAKCWQFNVVNQKLIKTWGLKGTNAHPKAIALMPQSSELVIVGDEADKPCYWQFYPEKSQSLEVIGSNLLPGGNDNVNGSAVRVESTQTGFCAVGYTQNAQNAPRATLWQSTSSGVTHYHATDAATFHSLYMENQQPHAIGIPKDSSKGSGNIWIIDSADKKVLKKGEFKQVYPLKEIHHAFSTDNGQYFIEKGNNKKLHLATNKGIKKELNIDFSPSEIKHLASDGNNEVYLVGSRTHQSLSYAWIYSSKTNAVVTHDKNQPNGCVWVMVN